jgi:hypothetical protein
MAIRANRTKYELVPRYKHKRGGKSLSGFALDLTIRFNRDGAAFVQDHNMPGDNTMPFNDLREMLELVNGEIERHYAARFGST